MKKSLLGEGEDIAQVPTVQNYGIIIKKKSTFLELINNRIVIVGLSLVF